MNRLWIMDRGIPTEEALKQMRAEAVNYLVGTPRGRLSKLADQLFAQPWKQVQEQIEVKLARDGEDLYVLTRSGGRRDKEQSIRRRKLKRLWNRLHEIRGMKNLTRDALLLKLGAAKRDAGSAWKLVEIEQAFKELKDDLNIRPVYHQLGERIESHIFVSFLSYCLQVTLKQRAKAKAPGLTPRAILEKFKAMQMIDVHLPTTDGRTLILPRYTQPEKALQLLLHQLNLTLPEQPPPRLEELKAKCGADL